ncbi:MAG: hypothetical protein ACTSXW_01735 [Candidatus Baldrarchaeia archaeon]
MRVTVDKDYPSDLELLKTYFNMKFFTGKEPEVRISKSGRGYHFIVRGLRISFETSLHLRRFLGDDETRVLLDEIGYGKPRQVLFLPLFRLTHPNFLLDPQDQPLRTPIHKVKKLSHSKKHPSKK